MNKYIFKVKNIPLLTLQEIEYILSQIPKMESNNIRVSLSLGIDFEEITATPEKVIFRGKEVSINFLLDLKEKLDERTIIGIFDDDFNKIAWYSDGKYYKLCNTGFRKAPTLEISGIHMHRVTGIDPWKDSALKVKLLKVPRDGKILDICTGLGYTAINMVINGARLVYTIEKDINVLQMAELNPWSRRLSDARIHVILGDATEVLGKFPNNYFDRILHDPPRFALAPELYTRSFYEELYRILKPGGRLVHYTGSPGSKYRRIDIARGVIKKLKEIGFKAYREKRIQGVIALKKR